MAISTKGPYLIEDEETKHNKKLVKLQELAPDQSCQKKIKIKKIAAGNARKQTILPKNYSFTCLLQRFASPGFSVEQCLLLLA